MVQSIFLPKILEILGAVSENWNLMTDGPLTPTPSSTGVENYGRDFIGPGIRRSKKITIFSENPAVSLSSPYGPLTSCKKAKKSLEPFSRKTADGLTDGLEQV